MVRIDYGVYERHTTVIVGPFESEEVEKKWVATFNATCKVGKATKIEPYLPVAEELAKEANRHEGYFEFEYPDDPESAE